MKKHRHGSTDRHAGGHAAADRRRLPRLRWSRLRGGEDGQSVLELSLVMPVVLFTLLGIGDLGRLFATVTITESAVREAADHGAFNSSNWVGLPTDPESNYAKTIDAMTERVCVASRHLPEFQGTRTACTNPAMTVALTESDGSPATGCDDPERQAGPCFVQVDLDYTFELLMPIAIEFMDTRLGLPETITFTRSSVFANSNFELDQ